MSTSLPTITIDDGIRSLLIPLEPKSLQQLEENLLRGGCRDALVVWEYEGKHILLDGHNRLAICTKHGIKYQVAVMTTKDLEHDGLSGRDAAEDWVDANQTGRRNQTQEAFTLTLGRMYNRRKKQQGAPEGNVNAQKQCGQDDHFDSQTETTAEKLASEHGVSEKTVRRAGKVADAVEEMKANKAVAKVLVKAVESGKLDVSKAAKIAELPKEVQETLLEDAERQEWSGRQIMEEAKRLQGEDTPFEAPAVVDESELTGDSYNLQQLKYYWRKASKKDKKEFLEWTGKAGQK